MHFGFVREITVKTWLENADISLAPHVDEGKTFLGFDQPQEVTDDRLGSEPFPEGLRVAVRDADAAGQDVRKEVGLRQPEVEEVDEARRGNVLR